ncbi:MAG: hypothetical protein EA396_06005 [Anaerolineaceae bacterium]|nr:MAG: hypothetical protein EA396_06005 [Anaerolineaceae bacterium]
MSEKTITRRQFLMYSAVAAGGLVALGGGAALLDQARRQQTITQDDIPAEPGSLDEQTRVTLAAMVAAYVGTGNGGTNHYAPFFDWQAVNVPEQRRRFTLFARTLNLAANDLSDTSYAAAPLDVRRAILRDGMGVVMPDSVWFDPQSATAEPDEDDALWLEFNRHIIVEMVKIFLQTNALIMLGYNFWPGQPAGLDEYTTPIEQTRGS